MKRIFVAFQLSPNDKLAVQALRRSALSNQDRLVPSDNFHMTLSFLGHTDHRKVIALVDALADLPQREFETHFDQLGYWRGPKVTFLAPSDPPAQIFQRYNEVQQIIESLGFARETRAYRPHITLQRGSNEALFNQHFVPLKLSLKTICVFESINEGDGVRYLPIHPGDNARHN